MGKAFKKTGAIWKKDVELRRNIIRHVSETLEAEYGRPRLDNPRDPLDDLIFIILSNKTSPEVSRRLFEQLKEEFPSWDALLRAPENEIITLLEPAGLATVKGSQIRAALFQIREDFGQCTLDDLSRETTSAQLNYLTSLSGVSGKVARCVMLYTLGSHVLPVDAHVHRIARRLGWTARKRADQCHEELEALVPAEYRFAFHVDCILHGRAICRPSNPRCDQCCIRGHCDYYNRSAARIE